MLIGVSLFKDKFALSQKLTLSCYIGDKASCSRECRANTLHSEHANSKWKPPAS